MSSVALLRWLERKAATLPSGLGRELLDDATVEVEEMVGPKPLSRRHIDATVEERPQLARFQVCRGTLYRVTLARGPRTDWLSGDEEALAAWIQRVLAHVPSEISIPDLDLVVNLEDRPIRGAPVFSRWVRGGDGNVRFPCMAHWEGDPAVSLDDPRVRADGLFDSDALSRPWEERANRVGWRGTATGMYDSTFRFAAMKRLFGIPWGRGVARLDLCRIAERHPDLIDAAITGWQQVSDDLGRKLARRFPTDDWVPRSWFLRHRYVVNVDGNAGTGTFLAFLGSGSVVLKQDSPYTEWCTRHLEPGEHYVPIRRNLGDLVSVARDVLVDPGRGRRVQNAGRRFAERYLTGRAVDFYILALFARYADRSPPVPEPHPNATEVPRRR